MYNKTIANLVSILLAIAVSVALFEQVFFKDNEPVDDGAADAAQPTWYVKSANLWTFDETGRKVQKATADRLRYFEEEDIAYLNAPRLLSYPSDDEIPWRTRADFGQFREEFDVVDLRDNVRIRKGDGEVTMVTQQLILTRSTNTAETDKPVLIKSGTSRTNAVGMRAWLDQEKIELLSKVRTVHEPQ